MTNQVRDILIVLAVTVLVIIIGGFFMRRSLFGFTETAILYLTGVLAGGMYWIGRKK